MKSTRRRFIQAGGLAALTASIGCKRLPDALMSGRRLAGVPAGPFQPPRSSEIDLIAHHLNRLSFGARPGDYQRVREMGETEEEAVHAYIEEQLHPERIDDEACERAVAKLATLNEPLGELFEYHDHVLLRELVHGTLLRAVMSKRQLYEVMVQFWTDHFNIDPSKGDSKWLKVWDDREVIRKFALGQWPAETTPSVSRLLGPFFSKAGMAEPRTSGKFPDLVRASALSPAMLWYLDGRENRQRRPEDKPNENYARELLELHTLGVRGGYSQQDVMEVARCLTGWTVRRARRGALRFQAGKVEFNPRWHDNGEKVVLGQTIPAGLGAGDLDRVLEIVSLHPSTAGYLALKLCHRFISEEPPEETVSTVAGEFLRSGGDIRAALRALFASESFRSARGLKFKRPFNYVVSALRASSAQVARLSNRQNDGPLYQYLRRMGHAPFDYPTPDGYPEEAGPWLGSLLWRWKFSLALSQNKIREAKVQVEALKKGAGGDEALMAHLLGRTPTQEEAAAYRSSGHGLALLLAAPAFQWS